MPRIGVRVVFSKKAETGVWEWTFSYPRPFAGGKIGSIRTNRKNRLTVSYPFYGRMRRSQQ